MEQHLRDLGSAELWHTSLERSRKRRVLAHDGRRRMTRKKQASGAVTAAMLLTPVLQVGGAMAASKGKSQVAQSSPANRAIDARTLNVVLEEGATGARVAQLQQLLGVDADGIFGPETAAAVRAFQGRAGLAADGIVGATTWRALFGSSSTRGVAADSVVDGKGYQVTVSKASKREAAIAGGGKGPVAKIVLTSAPEPKPRHSAPRHHTEAPAHSEPRGGGETRTVADQSAPAAPAAPEPAVDTGDGESVACGSGRLVNPVKGAVKTSPFGPRGGRNHDGVDLAAPTGTPIHAAACGVVSFAGQQSGYGNIVCIDHGSGFTTCYAHMSRFGTHNGARVHAGDVIGYVGSTGDATGPHLHFETRVNGQARNPEPYLNGSQSAPGSHARTTTAASSKQSSSSGSTKSSSTKTKSSSSTQTGAASAAAPSSSSSPQKPAYGESRPASAQPQQQPQAAPAEQQSQTAAAPAPVEQAAPAPAPQPTAAAAPAPVEQAAPAAPAPQPEAPAAPVEQAAPAPQPEAPAAPAAPAPDPAPQAEAPAPAAPAEAPAAPQADAPAAPAAPAAEAPAAPQAEAPAAPAEQPVAAAAG